MKRSIERFRNIFGIVSLLLLAEVMITFTIFQDQYVALVYWNYFILIICAFGLVWGVLYYQITPSWVGVILTLIHAISVILLLFIAKWLGFPRYDLLGILLSAVIGYIIFIYRDKLVSFILKFGKQK